MEYNKDEEEIGRIIDEVMKDIPFEPFIEPVGNLYKVNAGEYTMIVSDKWLEAFNKAMEEEFNKLNK